MPCFPSLACAEKNSSALQGGRWLEEPEGFPTHVSLTKGPLWPPHGEQKGARYVPRGCETPSAP